MTWILELNEIQFKSLIWILNKIKVMVWNLKLEKWELEDKEQAIIKLRFKWNWQYIIYRICPWKILSKSIKKWQITDLW